MTFDDLRRDQRDQRAREFVQACIVAAISGSMGQALPSDENVREIVRVARVIDDELAHPTEPKAPERSDGGEPPEPDDLIDQLGSVGPLA